MESKRLRQIKIRHLAAFVEILRCGSFKAAAERIALTQPTISKTLRELEEILGAPLLLRDRSGIALTPEGAVFRQFAEQSLAALNHGLASLDALSTGATAPLRIGALPSVAADLLPDVIVAFAEISPATPVMVEDGRIGALVERLRAGALDLVVGRLALPETMGGLSFTQLYAEQVIFAVAAGHPLAATRDLAALEHWPVLYPPKDAAIRPLIDRYLIARGIGDWSRRIETVSDTFGRAMTLGPAGAVWIISQGVVARDIAAGRMARLPLETDEMSGPVGIMARAEEDPSPPVRLFRQALLAAVRGGASA
ncbi:pca operon transcription factor PcaQ [Sulfitobacter aestuarii]|uniref:Pca operon transcription factor PcaQ n=1 Tax=Sulfitobacter aestuarii TaxID=2161676 RepID=A0ABW5U458_9RHOB